MTTRGMTFQLAAGGNVKPSRFCKLVAGTDHKAVQAGANEGQQIIGVSQEGSYNQPTPGMDTTYLAIDGSHLPMYTDGDEIPLKVGAADVNAGDILTSDADGAGVAATTGQIGVFRVTQGGAATEMCRGIMINTPVAIP